MNRLLYLKDVSTLTLDAAACIGCGLCLSVCPHGVLTLESNKACISALDRCMECGACAKNCPVSALAVHAGVGCASAIIHGWLTGKEPSCDCSGDGSC